MCSNAFIKNKKIKRSIKINSNETTNTHRTDHFIKDEAKEKS